MKLAILGASGHVGVRIIEQALARAWEVRGQTRDRARLAPYEGRIDIRTFEPADATALADFVQGCDAVLFTLGIDTMKPTTLFSETTRALVPAMQGAGVKRLVAITGVGAGETRGHGGWFYDWVLFPFFVRHRYADKDRQEALIAASDLDWTIVRPTCFSPDTPNNRFEVHTGVAPELSLRAVTLDEVADFIMQTLESGGYLRAKPFIGHR